MLDVRCFGHARLLALGFRTNFMLAMKEEPAPTEYADKNSFPWGRVSLWLFLILTLYVLSIGPVVMLSDRGYFRSAAAEKCLTTIYSPLIWAYENTFLRKPLKKYVDLWD